MKLVQKIRALLGLDLAPRQTSQPPAAPSFRPSPERVDSKSGEQRRDAVVTEPLPAVSAALTPPPAVEGSSGGAQPPQPEPARPEPPAAGFGDEVEREVKHGLMLLSRIGIHIVTGLGIVLLVLFYIKVGTLVHSLFQ